MTTTVPVSLVLLLVLAVAMSLLLVPIVMGSAPPEVSVPSSASGQIMWVSRTSLPQEVLDNVLLLEADGEVILKTHANDRHGFDADKARNCLTDPEKTIFYNPDTNRYGVACFTDGDWAVIILDKIGRNFEEVTSFLKEKMSRLDQVAKYLSNRGYYVIQ